MRTPVSPTNAGVIATHLDGMQPESVSLQTLDPLLIRVGRRVEDQQSMLEPARNESHQHLLVSFECEKSLNNSKKPLISSASIKQRQQDTLCFGQKETCCAPPES